jgi:hypothetical protein
MTTDHYILVGREIRKVDLMTWAKWLEEHRAEKIVKQEDVGGFWVSTVFLGLDHNWGDGPPILFETMVFPRNAAGGAVMDEQWCERCCTYDEAETMHERGCAYVREHLLS